MHLNKQSHERGRGESVQNANAHLFKNAILRQAVAAGFRGDFGQFLLLLPGFHEENGFLALLGAETVDVVVDDPVETEAFEVENDGGIIVVLAPAEQDELFALNQGHLVGIPKDILRMHAQSL